MCAPIVVGAVMGAIQMGLGIAKAHAAAEMQADANLRQAQELVKKRQIEINQATTALNQKKEKATGKGFQVTLAELEAVGKVGVQGAEAGLRGNYLAAISRNIDVQSSMQNSEIDQEMMWSNESADLQIGAADFRAQSGMRLLPEIPDPSLSYASSVMSGIGSGVSLGSSMSKMKMFEGNALGGWGWKVTP